MEIKYSMFKNLTIYVAPLSVPASKGNNSNVLSGTQVQSGKHKLTDDIPTHQSGDGPNIAASEAR